MKKKILITGANGFIGSSFINSLNEKYEIYGVFKSPPKANFKLKQTIIHDLSQDINEKLFTGIDVVLHLAQSNHYREQEKYANEIIDLNIGSTLKLLECAKNSSVEKFILASTGNVYKPSEILLNEDSDIDPASVYGASKAAAELLAKQYTKYFCVDILRIFSAYGPHQTNMLFPQMVQKIKSNEAIHLANSKGLYITPIYIADILKAIESIIDEDCFEKKYEIYNVSGKEIISLDKVVHLLSENLKIDPVIKSTEGQASYLTGSAEKLIKKFKLQKFTSIEKGIQNFIDSIK